MSFTLDGIVSNDKRVIVEEHPVRPIPQRKYERESVAGQNGDAFFIDEDAYENYVQPYKVYFSAEPNLLQQVAREAVAWLMDAPGYRRLEDSYNPGMFRRAAYLGGVDVENIMNNFGRATINFDCDPRCFLISGETEQTILNGQQLKNPTGRKAKPLIIVSGSGAGTLTVGSVTAEIKEGFSGTIYLDCESENAYADEALTISANSLIHAIPFLYLQKGETGISWAGGITAVSIIPRWWYV